MLPGPDIIIACLNCGALATVPSLLSGNTIGARWWTDGKMEAMMLPQYPEITKCHGCAAFYWVSDARRIGEIDYNDDSKRREVPEAWRDAENIRELSEDEYLQAIAGGLGKPRKRELYLRTRAWWAGNDAFRTPETDKPGQPAPPRSPAATANLERLFKLLRTKDITERLLKGEAARQLGRFKEAWDILWFAFPKQYLRVAAFLRDLIRNKDTIVRQIPQFKED
jgi:hypothetical protein